MKYYELYLNKQYQVCPEMRVNLQNLHQNGNIFKHLRHQQKPTAGPVIFVFFLFLQKIKKAYSE